MKDADLKIGDVVIIREWDDMKKEYGVIGSDIPISEICFLKEMKKYCGKAMRIQKTLYKPSIYPFYPGYQIYVMEGAPFFFTEEMFERRVLGVELNMNALIPGKHLVRLRNGDFYTVFKDTRERNILMPIKGVVAIPFDCYNNHDGKHKFSSDKDIMAIYVIDLVLGDDDEEIMTLHKIWKRFEVLKYKSRKKVYKYDDICDPTKYLK